MNHQGPENLCRERVDDEIDLVNLFLILWNRKTMIFLVTIAITIAAGIVSMFLPKVYEVTALIEPAEGVQNPVAIRENIISGAYAQNIAQKFGLSFKDIPDFKVSVPKDTDLVKISVQSKKPQQAVLIIEELLKNVKNDIQKKLDLKIKKNNNRIKEAQLNESLIDEQIKLLENQIEQTKLKITDLEKEKNKAISSQKDEAMAVLLYSNEIQNKQIYLNNLQDKIVSLRNMKQKISLDIDNILIEIEGMKGTRVNKMPIVPEEPIKPKKLLIVVLSFFVGLIGSIVVCFGVAFIDSVHRQQKAEQV